MRPILDLDDLAAIDWPVIVLFGGGMCLGQMMMQTGMAKALGALLGAVRARRAAAPALVLHLLPARRDRLGDDVEYGQREHGRAGGDGGEPHVGADPVGLGLAATAACTFGFMLPVSTPTNAMAYATDT